MVFTDEFYFSVDWLLARCRDGAWLNKKDCDHGIAHRRSVYMCASIHSDNVGPGVLDGLCRMRDVDDGI